MSEHLSLKIFTVEDLQKRISFWRMLDQRVVFTNGCFDIIHPGHVHLLRQCTQLGDRVVVGLNSDSSVKRLKGNSRPVNDENSRAVVLAELSSVDAVVLFSEDTPSLLIEAIEPDVLVKGGDWKKEDIAGAGLVESYGGKVVVVPYLEGHSTTNIISKSKG